MWDSKTYKRQEKEDNNRSETDLSDISKVTIDKTRTETRMGRKQNMHSRTILYLEFLLAQSPTTLKNINQ